MVETLNFRVADLYDFIEFNQVYSETQYLGGSRGFKMGMLKYSKYMEYVFQGQLRLCEINGKIAGYAIIKLYDDDTCDISQIFLKPEFQGQGIGRKFVLNIENFARDCHCEYVTLVSVTDETNKLWENMGYISRDYLDKYRKML